jgi:integrase
MPKKATELSAIAVKRLVSPGLYSVGGVTGLALQVSSTGARSWILRMTTMVGRRQELGLGGYPDVSLATARELARSMRARLLRGEDPLADRKVQRAALRASMQRTTFSQAARRWHAVKLPEYRNSKHAAQVLSTIETYANPLIGSKAVADVSTHDVLAVLEPIWTTKTETADRLRGRIENVLSWAAAAGERSGENPARWRGNLDALLPKPGKITAVRHHTALPFKDVPGFMAALVDQEGVGARALEFLILTAARSGEVRFSTWAEVDEAEGRWILPKERMKAGREHRVPLCPTTIILLGQLPKFEGADWLFPGPRGRPISDMTMAAVLRRMGADAVPHGFRSAFRDWAAECTSYPGEVVEMALAHAIKNKVEAAYRRGDLFEKRRELMTDWAKFAMSKVDFRSVQWSKPPSSEGHSS